MSELDEQWSQMLSSAIQNARSGGRHDVADYLELKAANDAVRRAGVSWLFNSMITIATENAASNVKIERTEPHNFQHRGANLVGSRLSLRFGVRCLSIEAGWTRTPADGFMRGGALAIAKLTHFGIPKENSVLNLVTDGDPPGWHIMDDNVPFTAAGLQRHFQVLTGQ